MTTLRKRLLQGSMVTVAISALLAVSGISSAVANDNIRIRDDAQVITAGDQQAIRGAAQPARFGLVVWTVKEGYAANKTGFVRDANALVGSNQVVVAVDITDHFVHVAAKPNTGLTADDTRKATDTTKADFTAGRWGAGIVAAVNTLAFAGPPVSTARGVPASSGSSFPWVPVILLAVFVGLMVLLVRRLIAGRSTGYGPGPGGAPPYAGGPGAGPGYGPGYGGGGGGGLGGGLMAGGLGAAAGGLLGYELGKHSDDRQDQDYGGGQGGHDQGNGIVESDTGSDNNADFGGGGGGDFGGGGGGGDF